MRVHRSLQKIFLAELLLAAPAASYAQVSIGISITTAPPVLPVYVQPPCPAPNYIWTPGYWAWGADGYYWVPGTWIMAPQPGYLWTPGYWGSGPSGAYLWHAGYWGPHVGFYGGVNYGFGYGGNGFYGGEWRGGSFAYNTAVVNVNRTVIHNTYINNTTIVNNYNRTSFNGGPNGLRAQPTAQERTFNNERHFQPTSAQMQHEQVARQDRANFASVNHGTPVHAAVARPVANVAELHRAAIPARSAPAAAAAVNARPGTPAVNNARPNQAARPTEPVNRPGVTTNRPEMRPGTVNRPQPTMNQPTARPMTPAPTARPQVQSRPSPVRPQTENRPAPAYRQTPTPVQSRPAPVQSRPAPAARPAPQQHESAQRPESRPHR